LIQFNIYNIGVRTKRTESHLTST